MNNKKAFTLVELIVVVTILAILSTVWFVAFSGYLEWVRDTNRISQLKSISDGLTLYQATAQLPLPNDKVEIQQDWTVIWYQWYAGENVTGKIEYSAEWMDPKDGVLFTYAITKERKSFALMAFLEEENGLDWLVYWNTTYASYENRIPYVTGRKIGVILDETNSPIQENVDIQTQWYINIIDVWSNEFQAYLSNNEIYSGTGWALRSISTKFDCKRLKDMKWSLPSGIYGIDPDGNGITTNVYCDMETDWGGWTLATMLADTDTENLFSESNVNEFITNKNVNVATRWRLSSIWTDETNRDIYLQCFSDQGEHKRYETPFIIYDFPGTSKENLTNDHKEWEDFAPVYLSAKWWNQNFTLNNLFNTDWNNNTMAIADTNWKVVFYLENDKLVVDDDANLNSPAYYSHTSPIKANLWGSVYCISAIR